MKRQNINLDWTIQVGQPPSVPMMPVKTRPVNLPHDFMIEGTPNAKSKNGADTGFFDGGTYTYTKILTIPEELRGQKVEVYFDGVYGQTTVILNGHVMGRHHYGYTPFAVDVTKQVKFGARNRLAVVVSNDNEPNGRWYSGGGIYRDVYLLTSPKTHLAADGVYLHTDHFVGEDAFVTCEAEVVNETAEDFCGWVDFAVKETTAAGRIRIFVPAGETGSCRTQICIEDVRRWDIDDPNLYEVQVTLIGENGEALDGDETIFGVRTISVDAKHGFQLNGRTVNLKGGCLHHDNGIIGAVSLYDAEYRKLKLHKDNGFNAIRCAHNPVSPQFLLACDRLGLVVIEEAFDTWKMSKNLHDFSEHFEDEGVKELKAFLRRDRNHPSIVMWSIGNELREQGGVSGGYETSAMLAKAAREVDATRPICGALCSFFSGLDDDDTAAFWKSMMEDREALAAGGAVNIDSKFGKAIWNDRTEAFAAPWDVVGYNYLAYHFAEAGELFPNRVICSTESKPREMKEYWEAVEQYPYLIGDFVWTSMDYIGEAGIGKIIYTDPEHVAQDARMLHYAEYPWRCAGAGGFDLLGNEKPEMTYRRIVWGSDETYLAVRDPKHHGQIELLGRYAWTGCAHSYSWDVEEGAPLTVDVYSRAQEVELLQNGVSLGRTLPKEYIATFETQYLAGDLVAVSYVDGKEVSRDQLQSGKSAAAIRLTPEKDVISADGMSLCYVDVEIVIENGDVLPFEERVVNASAEGAAVLQAFGSARAKTEESYVSGSVPAYQGRAMAVLRAGTEAGEVTLKVTAEGLASAEATIKVR